MANEVESCTKCGGKMEAGFVLEQNLTNYIPNVWIEGSPERSFWTVTQISGKTKRLVTSFRCVSCGYLESFATDEWTGEFPSK